MSASSSGNSGRNDGGSGSGLAASASFAVAKGAALIALAVIIGIVLLQVVDDGSSGPVSTGSGDGGAAATTTTEPESATTTTTAEPEGPQKAPAEVTVLVLNGGAPSGSAGRMSEDLRSVGYVTQLQASDDTENRDGNAVMCKEGLDREAQTLALAVGQGTSIEPFRDPPPPGSDEADCVVIVGRPVS